MYTYKYIEASITEIHRSLYITIKHVIVLSFKILAIN